MSKEPRESVHLDLFSGPPTHKRGSSTSSQRVAPLLGRFRATSALGNRQKQQNCQAV